MSDIPNTSGVQPALPGAGGSVILLAWEVEIRGLRCIAFAATKAKAQWIATKGYWDAYGRRKGEWPRADAKRAPRHDNARLKHDGPKTYSEEYVYSFTEH